MWMCAVTRVTCAHWRLICSHLPSPPALTHLPIHQAMENFCWKSWANQRKMNLDRYYGSCRSQGNVSNGRDLIFNDARLMWLFIGWAERQFNKELFRHELIKWLSCNCFWRDQWYLVVLNRNYLASGIPKDPTSFSLAWVLKFWTQFSGKVFNYDTK